MFLALLLLAAAAAAPGAELVVVLDNRAAVERGPVGRGQEQAAAALMRAMEGEARVTVIGLAPDERSPPAILGRPEQVEALAPVEAGALGPALAAARAVLETSDREVGALVLLAQGELAGGMGAEQAREALGLAPETRAGWVALGEAPALEALAASPWDLHAVSLEPEGAHERVGLALLAAAAPALGVRPVPDGEGGWTLPPRPALTLRLSLPEEAEAGRPVAVWAWLEREGARLDPRALGLGWEASLEVDGGPIPFALLEDGRWGGRWTPTGPAGEVHGRLRLRGEGLDLRADARARVEGELGPVLLPSPPELDLGSWESGPSSTGRCAEIDLSGSTRADELELLCAPSAPGERIVLICRPAEGQRAGGPVSRWEVCASAPPCCEDAPAPEDPPLSVRFLRKTEEGAELLATVPVRYQVIGQSLLRCRGPGVLITLLVAGGLLAMLGLRRAQRFDPGASLRVARSEPGLRRARPLALGRLAFARSALRPGKVAFDEEGSPLGSLEGAALVLEPGPGGAPRVARGESLERRLPGSAGWAPVDETERLSGLQPGVTYRVGERLYFALVAG